MSLIDIHVEMGRVADALEKIVYLLEKLVLPPPARDVKVHQATVEDLHFVTEEDVMRMQAEQRDFSERNQVAVGSPAMMAAVADWERLQREIHGEEWQAPKDWRSIFASVERDQSFRESAGAAGQRSPG